MWNNFTQWNFWKISWNLPSLDTIDNDLYALLLRLIVVEASWQKMTAEEGALLWTTESEFHVEFDRIDCWVEDVDSVVRFSAISLNSNSRPVNWATFTETWTTHSDAVVLCPKVVLHSLQLPWHWQQEIGQIFKDHQSHNKLKLMHGGIQAASRSYCSGAVPRFNFLQCFCNKGK